MSTASKKWDEISRLFEQATEIPKEHRQAWLLASTDDSKVVRRVGRMLEAVDSAVQFLDGPLETFAPDLIIDSVQSKPRDRIGGYRLEEEIGRGGMGTVYRGVRDDGQFDHQVAVKLLKPGRTSGHLERRFLAERQILASLNHPNIAKLLDGGVTTDGEPYFIMEYVDGAPITDYCRENRCSMEERLRLITSVCDAVSHAHQKLVVHRDLKPSNIYVTRQGRIKLLDFGIAKLLDVEPDGAHTPLTHTGFYMLTPEYATPEQLTGDPITTASDVYQIGLLLYELLTGQRPYHFETRSVTELTRVVCDEEPTKPSLALEDDAAIALGETNTAHWKHHLRGDLDAIVLKTLRKVPSERYGSIDKLSEDLRDHLAGFPVSAGEGTSLYRARKFVGRHRWQVGAAVAIMLMAVGYAVTVTFQNRRTAEERDRAEHYAAFLTNLLASPDPLGIQAEVDQRDVTVQAFLDQSVERIRGDLSGEPRLEADLLGTVGDVYENLGIPEKARPTLRTALDAARAGYGPEHAEIVDLMRRLAMATDDLETADSLYRAQLEMAARIEGGAGPLTQKSLVAYGGYLFDAGRWKASDSVLAKAMALDPDGIDPFQSGLAALYRGRASRMLDSLSLADSLLRAASMRMEEIYGPAHPYSAMAATELAAVTEFKGDFEAAEPLRRQALGVFERRLGSDHPMTVRALNNLAILLSKKGQLVEAESLMRQILGIQSKRFGDNHHEAVNALQNLATFLMKQGRLDEAEPLFHEISKRYAAVLPAESYLHAFPNLSLTEIHLRRGDYRGAETTARSALRQLTASLPSGHPLTATARSRLGAALIGQGRYRDAEGELKQALADFDHADGFGGLKAAAQDWLVELYRSWGKSELAEKARARFEMARSDSLTAPSPSDR